MEWALGNAIPKYPRDRRKQSSERIARPTFETSNQQDLIRGRRYECGRCLPETLDHGCRDRDRHHVRMVKLRGEVGLTPITTGETVALPVEAENPQGARHRSHRSEGDAEPG